MATQDSKELSSNQLPAPSTPMPPPDQPAALETAPEHADGPRRVLRPRKREPTPVKEPAQKRTRRAEAGTSAASKPAAALSRHRQIQARDLAEQERQEAIMKQLEEEEEALLQKIKAVQDKVKKRHTESFNLREERRRLWNVMDDCDISVITSQRYIVGLNRGDREHFLKHLESTDKKADKTDEKLERLWHKLAENRAKVDGLSQEHAALLPELERIRAERRNCRVPNRKL